MSAPSSIGESGPIMNWMDLRVNLVRGVTSQAGSTLSFSIFLCSGAREITAAAKRSWYMGITNIGKPGFLIKLITFWVVSSDRNLLF